MPRTITLSTCRTAALLALLLCGCRPAAPRATTQPANAIPGRAKMVLRDYVRSPLAAATAASSKSLRIVSLAPSLTEICCALGLRDQLVGRTRYCTYPPDVLDVPSLGALTDLNAELLVTLKPDLILISGRSRAQSELVARLGLPFESMPDTSLNDVFTALTRVGALSGRTVAAAELVAAIRADLAAVAARYADVPSARVLILTATLSDPPAPPFVGGSGSFYDELLKMAGHTNAAEAAGRAFAPLSLEFILRADPDVIIELDPRVAARPGKDERARAVWSKVGPLSAVAHRRVRVLSGSQHYLLGPRIAQTFYAICAAAAGESVD